MQVRAILPFVTLAYAALFDTCTALIVQYLISAFAIFLTQQFLAILQKIYQTRRGSRVFRSSASSAA